MRAKVLNETAERVFALIFDTGEDPMAGLTRFAQEQNLTGAGFTAIGAFSQATLGYFDWDKKDYERIAVNEQVEVLALVGDIASRAKTKKRCMRTWCSGAVTAARAAGTCCRPKCGPRSKLSSLSRPATLNGCMTPRAALR